MRECQNKVEVKPTYIPPWTETIEGMHMVYGDNEDQFRIQYTPDIVYAQREKPLHLQLFTHWTPMPEKKYPLVVHVRGSGWHEQDIYGFLPQLTDIARCGYIVASVEYRTTEDGCGFPAQIEDTKAAIHFLKDHAEEYGIDPERIAVMGDSSGGHTALLTGYTGTEELCREEEKGIDLSVKCVVDFFGPSDFTRDDFRTYPCGVEETPDSPFNMLVGNAIYTYEDPAAAASPVSYITKEKRLPATLIVHGDRDNMCPFPQSVRLYRKLTECGQPVDFYMVRNAAHGAKIWIPKVMEIVTDFLKAHL